MCVVVARVVRHLSEAHVRIRVPLLGDNWFVQVRLLGVSLGGRVCGCDWFWDCESGGEEGEGDGEKGSKSHHVWGLNEL